MNLFSQPFACGLTLALALQSSGVMAGNLTVQTNKLGATSAIIGYDMGHFYSGSNTRDWWRYSGVTGARVFVPPNEIEPTDDIAASVMA